MVTNLIGTIFIQNVPNSSMKANEQEIVQRKQKLEDLRVLAGQA